MRWEATTKLMYGYVISRLHFYRTYYCSLLMWRHEASRRLYLILWLALPATLLVPAAHLSTFLGFYLLFKMMVIDYIFLKFPRLRAKYDTSSLIWQTLPTDADLEVRHKVEQVTSFVAFFKLFSLLFESITWQKKCLLLKFKIKKKKILIKNIFKCDWRVCATRLLQEPMLKRELSGNLSTFRPANIHYQVHLDVLDCSVRMQYITAYTNELITSWRITWLALAKKTFLCVFRLRSS